MKTPIAFVAAVATCLGLGVAASQPRMAGKSAPKKVAAPPVVPLASCSNTNLTANVPGPRLVDGTLVYSRRIATILDPAIADFGIGGADDDLELYCVSRNNVDPTAEPFGWVAVCLSKEPCPWR